MALMEKIKNQDEWAIGALIALYNHQTADERSDGDTKWENGLGFNAIDANVLSDISEFYLKRGYLTEKQISFVRRAIVKYRGQLENMEDYIRPQQINRPKEETGAPVTPLKRASLDGDKIVLRFRFPKSMNNEFYSTLKFIKTIRFARFSKKDPAWYIPFTPDNVDRLLEDGWNIEEAIRGRYRRATQVIDPDDFIDIPGINGEPYPFQYSGISFIDKAGGRALIGDDMGLGKTIQAVGWLQLHKEARPAVVVCPASLKKNWAREAKKWMSNDEKIVVLEGYPNGAKLPEATIYVVNYDIFSNTTKKIMKGMKEVSEEVRNTGWGDILMKINPTTIIADECHYIKNNKALRTIAFKRIAKKIKNVIGLSGTPIENKPIEFYNILHIIKPDLFSDWEMFVTKYCGGVRGRWGWEYNPEKANGKALHDLISKNVMIRRLKSEVLTDLPPKCRNVVSLPMSKEGTKNYIEAMEEILTFDPNKVDANQTNVLSQIERGKQMAVAAKLDAAKEWVENFLETGNKLVLFCEHKAVADFFEKKFKKICVRITGAVSSNKRQDLVDAFQEDPKIRLFIGSQAAKEGLTLTAAADTAFLEFWWKPGTHDQAEDRVNRIGQEASSINAWYLIAEGTIEEDIFELLDEKRKMVSEVLDGKQPTDSEMLTALLSKLKDKQDLLAA